MSSPLGRNALQKLLNFRVRAWFRSEFPRFAEDVVSIFKYRNEILDGGVVVAGASVTASVLQLTTTPSAAIKAMLKGRLMADIAAFTDTDIFATAGSVGQAIFEDGADASGISLATDETAYVTLIECNSDGAGGADEDDGGTPLLVAVVAGTATTYMTQTAYSSSQDIQDALEASTGVHAGVTGWAHIAQILWDENSASPTITVTMNRNNAVADA